MPTFYVSGFAEPDLPILAQLVRDPVFSQVSGETIARYRLKRHRCRLTVNFIRVLRDKWYLLVILPALYVVAVLDL